MILRLLGFLLRPISRRVDARIERELDAAASFECDVFPEALWTATDDAALAQYAEWARRDDQNIRVFREGEL